jgi:xylulose-5-phosphate/fructose-6-phosphate phosphoketolase
MWSWQENTGSAVANMDQAIEHCTGDQYLGNGPATIRSEPDVVMAAAAMCYARNCWLPFPFSGASARIKDQGDHVVDLMKLQPAAEHPHGLSDPISMPCSQKQTGRVCLSWIPVADPRLTYRRTNHANLHVPATRKKAPSPPTST